MEVGAFSIQFYDPWFKQIYKDLHLNELPNITLDSALHHWRSWVTRGMTYEKYLHNWSIIPLSPNFGSSDTSFTTQLSGVKWLMVTTCLNIHFREIVINHVSFCLICCRKKWIKWKCPGKGRHQGTTQIWLTSKSTHIFSKCVGWVKS